MTDAQNAFLLYFGCWGEAGHFVFDQHKHTLSARRGLPPMALRAEELDGSRVFLPWPEVPGRGRMSYLIRENSCTTVMAWWDRTFDKRGACCAAIQCDGWEQPKQLWARFARVYEPLAKQLVMPQLVGVPEITVRVDGGGG